MNIDSRALTKEKIKQIKDYIDKYWKDMPWYKRIYRKTKIKYLSLKFKLEDFLKIKL